MESGEELDPELTTVEWESVQIDRGAHPDYMTKEILEQPDLLRALARRSPAPFEELARRMKAAGEVFMIGCVSASHARSRPSTPSPAWLVSESASQTRTSSST